MKKITVIEIYDQKTHPSLSPTGASCGELLMHPGTKSRNMLEAAGFHFFSEAELSPEQADVVVCMDLTPEWWERIKVLPSGICKILQLYESPIYARLSFSNSVLRHPCWNRIMTWSRAYEADYIVPYDIPIALESISEQLIPQQEITPEFIAKPGVAISPLNRDDFRGVVPQRNDLYRKLAREGMIDLYGTNWAIDPRRHLCGSAFNKGEILRQHPFALVIENIWAPGYVTENLPECILAGIPVIYWGDFSNAQRRFPGTFVPLEEISITGFLKARESLAANYDGFRHNVLKCRAESGHWCDSYLEVIRKCFRGC